MTPVEIAQSAKRAFEESQLVTHEERVKALEEIRGSLAKHKDAILAANRKDIEVSPCACMQMTPKVNLP